MSKTEQVVHLGKVHTPAELKPSGNRKLSPYQHQKKGHATEATVVVKNSMGTLSSECKWTTPFCEGCYATATEVYPNVHALLSHNTGHIKGKRWGDLVPLFDKLVHDAEVEMIKRNVPLEDRCYRPHWDGELDSFDELEAWNTVAGYYPDMKVYMYTRAHHLVKQMLNAKGPGSSHGTTPHGIAANLVIYLSVDRYNIDTALAVKNFDPKGLIKYAYCGDTWEETEEVASHFKGERKGPRCPELTGKIPLIVWETDDDRDLRRSNAMEAGMSEKRVPDRVGKGACVECGMCPDGINNVRFAQER